MKLPVFFPLFLAFSVAQAQPSLLLEPSLDSLPENCWQQEVDPSTGRIFASRKIYGETLTRLQEAMPERPGIFSLIAGYQVYQRELGYASSLPNDKIAHCYVGCVIALEVDAPTAHYAGWYKEYEDLTDCRRGTRFEWEDIIATARGAQLSSLIGANSQGKEACSQQCRDLFRRR